VKQQVVVDDHIVTSAGVSAGIDGALCIAALLRGPEVAQQIQLSIEYAPDPPFRTGDLETAPRSVVDAVISRGEIIRQRRVASARRYAEQFGSLGQDTGPG
jgi:cyclohexyl-isocyanide hydratase